MPGSQAFIINNLRGDLTPCTRHSYTEGVTQLSKHPIFTTAGTLPTTRQPPAEVMIDLITSLVH